MAPRRSLIALLCAVFAVLAVPSVASAGTFASSRQLLSGGVHAFSAAVDCTDPDPPWPGGDPDVTAPSNDTPAAPGGWLTGVYTVTLAGSDAESGVAHMQYCVDGGTATNIANATPISINSSGVYTLITRAVDNVGNASPWRPETVSIDMVAPSDTTDSGTLAWTPTTRTVTVSAFDAVSGVDHVVWQLDGGSIHNDPNNTDVPIVGDGTHTLRTRAVDVAGNISNWVDHTVRVDTVDPVDETAAPGGWQTAAYGVVVTGSDVHSGIANVTYSVDGGAPVTGSSPATVNVSAEGEHTVTTYVTDNAGNQSTPKTFTIRIDTTAPTNQTPTADPGWRGADYSVMLSGADSGSGVRWLEWRVDSGPITRGGPAPLQATVGGTGTHTFETRVIDAAGNASNWRPESVDIDRVAPTNTTTPAPSSPVGSGYTVTIAGTDVPSGIDYVEWKLDPADVNNIQNPTSGPSGSTQSITGNGDHILASRVVDKAGNKSSWRIDHITIDAVTGDATPPTDTTTLASLGWEPGAVNVTVQADDGPTGSGVAWVEWRGDDGLVKSTRFGDDPHLTFTTDGDHMLETRAADNAGRTTGWREQHYKIDTTTPHDDTVVPAGWSHSRTVALAGSDDVSDIAEIEYRVGNSGPFLHGTVGQLVDVGADGTFTIWHRAIDLAGHATPRVSQQLKVDGVPPANNTVAPPFAWQNSALSWAISGSDATPGSGLAPMQWRVDGGDIHDGGPALVDTDGVHTLETRAVDVAGNDSGWRSDTVRVDLTDPTNTTPAAPSGWRSAPYAVTVSGDDGAGSGVTTLDIKVDGVTVAGPGVTVSGDGVHTIDSQITDAVGHTSGWRTDTVRIDSVVPTATLTCTSGTGWIASVSCTPTADGGPSGLGALTLATDGGTPTPVTSGVAVPVTGDGAHTITLRAVDGAGNVKTATAQVNVDATAPTASLSCAAASTATGYVCQAAGTDGLSGLFALSYSLNGGAWAPVPGNGSFTVASGTVRVMAVDAAGNAGFTAILTLPVRTPPAPPVTLRTKSTPVYLAGHHNDDGMVGALVAARSASGTVSVDLRPLAVGRGRYQVVITLKSGKHKRTVKKTQTVARGGTLRRMAASLTGASGRTTVTLTVRKQHGHKWRNHAAAKVVLAK
jgi:hypothetical protein